MPIRSASEVADMIIENTFLYSREKGHGQSIPRVKMKESAVRRISGHTRILPESYVEQLVLEMQQRDWLMARYDANEFLFFAYDIAKNWTTLSAKRVVPNDDLEVESESQ